METSYLDKAFGLQGKVAIVTGASRGLGQGMALGLANAGADIVAVGTRRENLATTVEKIEALGRKVLPLACDQTKPVQIDKVIAETMSHFGQIDILVNNAGTIKRAPAHEFSDDDWNEVIDTNLNGVFRFCREAGKVMLKQRSGKIINIASLLSFSGGITVPAYAASKGAVMQLTKALANEWAESNIQVNAIAPGYFETDNTVNLRKDEARVKAISARIPCGRWGIPEDMQGAAIFLASSSSNYVNGQVLLVDGGWMAR
ncbi:MAG: 2-dehydro-3-deoxy-D-gluconate 5-dehydrogenase KduD [Pseudomonadales bacterium]